MTAGLFRPHQCAENLAYAIYAEIGNKQPVIRPGAGITINTGRAHKLICLAALIGLVQRIQRICGLIRGVCRDHHIIKGLCSVPSVVSVHGEIPPGHTGDAAGLRQAGQKGRQLVTCCLGQGIAAICDDMQPYRHTGLCHDLCNRGDVLGMGMNTAS